MFAPDTDYDLITPTGDALLAELGIDVPSVRDALTDDRACRCPDRKPTRDKELEGRRRKGERQGAGERDRLGLRSLATHRHNNQPGEQSWHLD